MDDELHYLAYDPDEMMLAMMQAYTDAGGSVIRAGDEKEMLLRGVQDIMILAFAGIDNALRMATLRYAVGQYLDMLGENIGCNRIEAAKATAKITITTGATGSPTFIPAGSALTQDGVNLYVTDDNITLPGTAGTITANITAEQAGSKGNGLLNGVSMQFIMSFDGVEAVVCSASAKGGQDTETDDVYRERIREYGLSSVTTGPSEMYERLARETSGEIIDAKAVHGDDLDVDLYLILKDGAEASTIKAEVAAACNPKDKRPLNDHLSVYEAEDVDYTLIVGYAGVDTTNLADAVAAAVEKYQEWQDNVIGQVFNPDILKSYLYNAGCTFVVFEEGSEFNSGAVEYTPILESQRCKGTITTEVVDPDSYAGSDEDDSNDDE